MLLPTSEKSSRDPQRTLPLSLFLGTIIVSVIYLGLNAVYLYAMPLEEMKGVLRIGEMATERLFPSTAAPFLNVLFMATILGAVSAMTIAGPRVYFAMARDRLFPAPVARIHPRYQTPSTERSCSKLLWASTLGFFRYICSTRDVLHRGPSRFHRLDGDFTFCSATA